MIDLSAVFNSGLEENIKVGLYTVKGIIDVDYIGNDGGFKNALGRFETYDISCYIQSSDAGKFDVGSAVEVRGKSYKIKEIINEQTDIVTLKFGQKT